VILYGSVGETEANRAAAESLKAYGFSAQPVKVDGEATTEDLSAECLIIIGRPEVNKIAARLQDRFPIKFEGARFTWRGKVYDQATQGAVEVVEESHSSKRLTILCAGLSPEATRGICATNVSYAFILPPSWVGLSDYGGMASYLIFDGNKCVLSGEWENADPDLVEQF
jgi:hypothetical protein